MTIPVSSLYPDEFDSDNNLYAVHDSLRFTLVEDYNPGDTSILVEGDFLVVERMPPTGLITLTEQCSDIDERAISFYYSGFDTTTGTISGLELLSGFPDVKKPKRITHVTVNVMAEHHNNLKNALIEIQEFCGVKGTEDKVPFGPTLEGRINFLRRLVMQPKAWFTSDKRTGNVPLEIEFQNLSFRLGTDGTADEVKVTWDFGDHTASVISLIEVTDEVPENDVDVIVRDTDGGKVRKTYLEPGLYDVKLTVENNFGSDSMIVKNYVNARVKAPNTAVIRLIENASNQEVTPGVPPDGPFDTFPKIRSPINTLIEIEVPTGENVGTPGYSFAGELLNGSNNPIDPVVAWAWALGDDLNHPSAREAKASYSVGGVYDLKLRVDTQFGAFRITTYPNVIDVIENVNMWLWIFDNDNITARGYEYGLISETFKLMDAPSYTVARDESFLDNVPNATQQKREFRKNVGFVPRNNIQSGQGGSSLLYYATGRTGVEPISAEKIAVIEFDGFSGTYITRTPITRPWNWANLNSTQNSYFVFGAVSSYPPSTSPTNVTKQSLSLANVTVTSQALTSSNYINGAQELAENVVTYDGAGDSVYGQFSVYRTAWKDSTGYILRNNGVGPFFRLKSFYRTEGTASEPFTNIRKLQDIAGPTKLDGQLVDLSSGLYFLNNSGSVSKYTPDANAWTTGGPGINSLLYRNLQDTSVIGFDSESNTLLAVSDHDKRAYLSFDYSSDALLRFSEIDLTFANLGSRPSGSQWISGIY